MRKLVESTHVSLGGVVSDPQDWYLPYMDGDHQAYADRLLEGADALLLGRVTYEGLSAAYQAMEGEWAARMNALPKYVASRTLREAGWNATIIQGDVAEAVADLKARPGANIVKWGTGPLDRTLMEHGLIDELHLWLAPVAVPSGQRLFEDLAANARLQLADVTRFPSGVLVLVYTP